MNNPINKMLLMNPLADQRASKGVIEQFWVAWAGVEQQLPRMGFVNLSKTACGSADAG